MAKKTKVIGPLKIDAEGAKKIGKSFLISVGGLVIAGILQITEVVDFGTAQSFALVFFPWLANVLKIWIGKYEVKA